jgi:hypothetical protein
LVFSLREGKFLAVAVCSPLIDKVDFGFSDEIDVFAVAGSMQGECRGRNEFIVEMAKHDGLRVIG